VGRVATRRGRGAQRGSFGGGLHPRVVGGARLRRGACASPAGRRPTLGGQRPAARPAGAGEVHLRRGAALHEPAGYSCAAPPPCRFPYTPPLPWSSAHPPRQRSTRQQPRPSKGAAARPIPLQHATANCPALRSGGPKSAPRARRPPPAAPTQCLGRAAAVSARTRPCPSGARRGAVRRSGARRSAAGRGGARRHTVVDPHAIVRGAGYGEAAALRERRAELADVRHVPKAVLRNARFLRGARGARGSARARLHARGLASQQSPCRKKSRRPPLPLPQPRGGTRRVQLVREAGRDVSS
jgi:hypothetical protein